MDELVELRGQIERVTYTNAENGYSVLRLKVAGDCDLVTAVGSAFEPTPGEVLRLHGAWTSHPKFGEQFQFVRCESVLPATVEGIKRFLASGLLRGVGPSTAELIVGAFGERTLDVIDDEPEKLLELDGIGKKRLEMILASWEEQKEIRSVMLFLQSHGVSATYAVKIFRVYGAEAIDVVKENPYRLARDVFGIGFATADKIAQNLGFAHDSPQRADAGTLYAIGEIAGEGHVYAPRGELTKRTAELLDIAPESAGDAIARMIEAGELVRDTVAGESDEPEEAIYLPIFLSAEARSAQKLAELAGPFVPPGDRAIDVDAAVAWVQNKLSIDLEKKQEDALRLSLSSKMLVITGGPGTGKTTLIRAIIEILGSRGANIALAAPTGRAAKRMAEATGHEAKTIHRMLEYNGSRGGFMRGADFPLECDLLIVDEASMIDALLMYHLLRAIPKEAMLILVGDIHQLPSVGPGNVLGDIIASGVVPVVELTEIFRQAQQSRIIVNAHRINTGLMPIDDPSDDLRDFYFIETDDPEKCLDAITRLVSERIPDRFGLDPIDDIQVLTPMHKGTIGASNLNLVLQRTLNQSGGAAVERGGKIYKAGDKVMQIRNNYDRDIFNGDIGRISAIDTEARELWVDFYGRDVLYEFASLDELVHAYAVSIHKSQGSEYPAVVIPILTQHYVMLQRNLLYTGITRGKKLVVIVGSSRALAIAVGNDKTKRRWTNLSDRMRKLHGE